MSYLLSCQALSKSFGAVTLFSDIDVTLHAGDRLGLIGPNGSGKSTLLKILAGISEADSGKVRKQRHIRCSYLPQDVVFDDGVSVADVLYAALQNQDIDDAEQYTRVNTMLSRAGLSNPELPAANLSGGWRKRLAISRALIIRPNILLMDEPTNHLDLASILWLEKLLNSKLPESPDAYIVVSHDRTFLEHAANRIIELSRFYPTGYLRVNGTYSRFVLKRQEFLDNQQQHEQRLANRARRENEWLQRGPKARTTKARSRIDAAHDLQKELTHVRARNRAGDVIRVDFDSTGRKTKKLLEAKGIGKKFQENILFKELDITLTPGSRLGLLGGNGCGKSTLMKILATAGGEGDLEPDTGTVRVADGVRIVNFDQNREQINPDITLRRALAPEGDSVVYRDRSLHVNSWAKRFLFRADQLETPVGQLSGGEQARILIAGLMRQPADILLLDEPTNDLDIPSLEVLEESLQSFPGALVLVTHDRFLLDRVTDRILGFDGCGGIEYYAEYKQWITALERLLPATRKQNKKKSANKNSRKKKTENKGKLSYIDQREYDGMEERILDAEAEQQRLRKLMADSEISANPDELQKCWLDLEEVEKKVVLLYNRWEELEEKKS